MDVVTADAEPRGIDDCERYPLFTPGLIAAMRRHIPVERHDRVARSIHFLARKPQ